MRFTRSETCAFINSYAGELKKLAKEAKLESVEYLLEVLQSETRPDVSHAKRNALRKPEHRAAIG
jgi:hypothetical protein